MKAVDVLRRRDRFQDSRRIDVRGQRQLHENAVNGGIGVQRLDEREQFGFARLGRQVVLDRMEAAGLGRPALARHIGLAGRIVADQDNREAGRHGRVANARASAATSASTPSAIAAPSSTKAEAPAIDRSCADIDATLNFAGRRSAPRDARAPRLDHAHAGLVAEFALEPVRIAVAGPRFEAKERRARPCPERSVGKARIFHRDRRARSVDERQRPACAVEKAKRVVSEQLVGELEVATLKRNWPLGLLDEPARREDRNLGPLHLIEPHKSAIASGRAERPAEARVEPAGVRGGLRARIGDFDRNRERLGTSRYSTVSAKANG